jgi:hypothetical protein
MRIRDFGPIVSVGREINAIDNLFVSPTGHITLSMEMLEPRLDEFFDALEEFITNVNSAE